MQDTKAKNTHKDIIFILILIISLAMSAFSVFMTMKLQTKQENMLTVITRQGLLRDAKFECLNNKQNIDNCDAAKEAKRQLDEAYKRLQ
jgi:hypothetical protein